VAVGRVNGVAAPPCPPPSYPINRGVAAKKLINIINIIKNRNKNKNKHKNKTKQKMG